MFTDSCQKRYCNEYDAQTMFCQSQTFPTVKKPDFVWIFWKSKKDKLKGLKKPEFQNLASKMPNWQPWAGFQQSARMCLTKGQALDSI